MANNLIVGIVANDKTAAGITSAEKRFQKFGKNVEGSSAKIGAINDSLTKLNRTSGTGIIRTFGAVEKATARAFGASSPLAKAGSQLQGLKVAIGGISGGIIEAVDGTSTMVSRMGAVGKVVAAVAGSVTGAALLIYKAGDKWAGSLDKLNNFAKGVGIAPQNIERIQQVGTRYGISPEDTTAGLGSIATTFHDASVGRNMGALAQMTKMGMTFQRGKDGNLDYTAMTLQLADRVKRQKDPQTALALANLFGASNMLPVLKLGSGGLRRELGDVNKRGLVHTASDLATARGEQYAGAVAAQFVSRMTDPLGRKAAESAKWQADQMAKAPILFHTGVATFDSAVDRFKGAIEALVGRDRFGGDKAGPISSSLLARRRDAYTAALQSLGVPAEAAKGAIAGMIAENDTLSPNRRNGQGSNAYGLGQWMPDRQAKFKAFIGHDIHGSKASEQLRFMVHEWQEGERAAGRAIMNSRDATDAASHYIWNYMRPGLLGGLGDERRANRALNPAPETPQHHHHEIHIHKDRAIVKTRTRGRPGLAISHALDDRSGL